jgi:predicted dienelactone hydrolase
VWADAAPAEGPFDLAVYSHGHRGYAEASSYLMSYLASHGMVVAAPDHTGNTTFDDPARNTSSYTHRAMDISATIDHLQDHGPASLSESIIVYGHSFGGYTVHALAGAVFDVDGMAQRCEAGSTEALCTDWSEEVAALFERGLGDDRIDGFVPMAAGDLDLFGVSGLQAVEAPVLMMDGSMDPPSGNGHADEVWQGFSGRGNTRLHILGGGHQTFTDMSGILESFEGLIEAEEGARIQRIYAMAFTHVLRGDSDYEAVLSGDFGVSEAAVLSQ